MNYQGKEYELKKISREPGDGGCEGCAFEQGGGRSAWAGCRAGSQACMEADDRLGLLPRATHVWQEAQ